MPNENRQRGVVHTRAILFELKNINEKLDKMIHLMKRKFEGL
jgi:hypothetical protein